MHIMAIEAPKGMPMPSPIQNVIWPSLSVIHLFTIHHTGKGTGVLLSGPPGGRLVTAPQPLKRIRRGPENGISLVHGGGLVKAKTRRRTSSSIRNTVISNPGKSSRMSQNEIRCLFCNIIFLWEGTGAYGNSGPFGVEKNNSTSVGVI